MNEHILVKSERSHLLRNLVLIIGISVAIAAVMVGYSSSQEYIRYYRSVSQVSIKLKEQYSSAFSYAFAKSGTLKYTLIISIFTLMFCASEVFRFTRSYMVVTSKRVYGVTAWGKRVDLPLDSVTAISTGLWKTVSVSTPSGKVSFSAVKNRDAIFQTLSNLIIERQQKM